MADMIPLKECWGRGIRPKRDMARDTRYCRNMVNLIPLGDRGARTLRQVTYPLSSPSLSMSWPFPQILRDENVTLFLDNDDVRTIATSSYPFTATQRDVFNSQQVIDNRRFETTTGWTTPSGWAITNSQAVATGATSNPLTYSGALTNGVTYLITYTITRSAGSITPTFGTQAGTTRSASGTYTEEVASDGTDFLFATSGFTGTVDSISMVAKTAVSVTGAWQLAAFQDLWFATSGQQMLYKIPSNPTDATPRDVIHVADNFAPLTVGKHNNALIFGGLQGTRLANSYMVALFNHWRNVQSQNQVVTEDDTLTDEYILYSEPSGAEKDLPFSLFLAAIGIPSTYEADLMQGIAFTRIEDRLLGFYKAKGIGQVRCVKQLGNDLIIYGKNGIIRAVRDENGYSEVLLSDQGIMNRMSVAGDESEHFFIGSRRDMWRLPVNGGLERLDYSEALSTLSESATVATFDPVRRYAWFGDGTTSFCYTGFGLGQSDAVIPSSLFRLSGNDGLFGTAVIKSDPQTAYVVGPIIGAPNNQVFEVSSLDVECIEADSTSWSATADWRMRQSDQFRRPTAIDVSDRGRTFVKKSGKDFRAYLVADNYKNVDLDAVNVALGIGRPSIGNIMSGSDTVLSETNP